MKLKKSAAGIFIVSVLLCQYSGFGAENPVTEKKSVAKKAPFPGWTQESFTIGYGNAQEAWVENIPVKEAWKPVEQADLAGKLKGAPKLETEQVGPSLSSPGTTRGHVYLCPNKDGTWDALFHYYKDYFNDQQVIIVDLGTGEQKTIFFNSKREGARKEFVTPFGSFYARGKLFFQLAIDSYYDSELNDIIHVPENTPPAGFRNLCMNIGKDHNLYIMGAFIGPQRRKEKGFLAGVLDTKTGKLEWHEPFGPSSEHIFIFFSWSIMDGDWMYGRMGKRPYYLMAYNFKTREHKVIATTMVEKPEMSFQRIEGGGVWAYIGQPDFVADLPDFDKEFCRIWIKDGKVFPRGGKGKERYPAGQIPPWGNVPAKRKDLMREFGINTQQWPADFTMPSQFPLFPGNKDVGDETIYPDAEGKVTYRYKLSNEGEWQTVSFKVGFYDAPTVFTTEINENVIMGAGGFYGSEHFYDISQKMVQKCVNSGVSIYTTGVFDNHFYVCGYPNSILADYDLTRPLAATGDASNPITISSFNKHSDTHYPTAGIARGADGRIYTGGSGSGRQRHGGGWSWYDPATGETGGEMLDDNISCLISVKDDRYILMSYGNELWVYDTTVHKFTHKEKLEGVDSPSYMVEALPGLVVGFSTKTVGKKTENVLYGCDPVARKVLWTKPVPASYRSVWMPVYRTPHLYRRGPDGFIWTYFDNTIVRIDPRTAEVHPVGIPSKKGFLGFAGGEVYIGGQEGLCKLKSVTVPVVKKKE